MCYSYHNGNDNDKEGQIRGFGHTGFLVDDLEAACRSLEERGVQFKKKPQDGNMKCSSITIIVAVIIIIIIIDLTMIYILLLGLAFAYDPDNYWYILL